MSGAHKHGSTGAADHAHDAPAHFGRGTSGSRNLFHSGVPISGVKAGETYGAYDARRDAAAATEYFGFGCLGDCRPQEAGHRWAVQHRIAKPRDCAGTSWGFVEGCAAYSLPRSSGEL